MERDDLEYVGFWPRVGASIIDTILVLFICIPLVLWVYGTAYLSSTSLIIGPADFFINWVLPAFAVVAFWLYAQATPGKMAISAKIVDASTGNPPTTSQCIIRYLGYFVSTIPFLLGFIWVAFDDRKQGWHDKLANTVVVRRKDRGKVVFYDQGS
jgi:uncharacterized RDD family membrane protein YckC